MVTKKANKKTVKKGKKLESIKPLLATSGVKIVVNGRYTRSGYGV